MKTTESAAQLSHKQVSIDLERATQVLTQALQHAVDKHQELCVLVRRLEEREMKTSHSLSEQVQENQQLQLKMEELHRRLEEKEKSLTQANQTVAFLRNTLKDLHQHLPREEIQNETFQEWLAGEENRHQKHLPSSAPVLLESPVSGLKQEEACHDDDGGQCVEGTDPEAECSITELNQIQLLRPDEIKEECGDYGDLSLSADKPTDQPAEETGPSITNKLIQEEEDALNKILTLGSEPARGGGSSADPVRQAQFSRVSVKLVDCCKTPVRAPSGTEKSQDGEQHKRRQLIGVQYRSQQTRKVLQDVHPVSDESEQILEELDMQETKGDEEFAEDHPGNLDAFDQFEDELDDKLLINPTAVSNQPLASSATSASNLTMDIDDPDCGLKHVDALAEYLVELCEQTSLSLSSQQASTIIALWQNLDIMDKEQMVCAARQQNRLLHVYLKSPKNTTSQVPGVESSSRPAERPDCCRLVEQVFIRLCIRPQKGEEALSWWSRILRDYNHISHLLVTNKEVTERTTIQLVEVNQNTLVQWHNKRIKAMKQSVLLQRNNWAPSLPEASEPLPESRTLAFEPIPFRNQPQYKLPVSTMGQAKRRKTRCAILPKDAANKQAFVATPVATTAPPQQVFTQTGQPVVLYQVVLPVEGMQGTKPLKRAYRRTVEANSCRKCGQFRTGETGHSQYRGRVYCPHSERLTKEQWLEEMRRKFVKRGHCRLNMCK